MRGSMIRRVCLVGVAAGALLALMCSNPTESDTETVSLRANVQVPLTNQRFNLATELNQVLRVEDSTNFVVSVQTGATTYDIDSFPELLVTRVVNVDSSYWAIVDTGPTPDTIPLNQLGVDSIDGQVVFVEIPERQIDSFPVVVDSMEDKVFDVTLGPIPMADREFSAGVPYAVGSPFTFPPTAVPLPGVSSVTFNAASAPITITIENIGAAPVNNAQVSIQGLGTSGGTTVPANGSATTTIPTAGGTISGNPQIGLTANTTGVGSLTLRFSLAGTLADQVSVVDSLIQIDTFFVNDYDLTDTVDIDYVDIADGNFTYSMHNGTGLQLYVKGVHEHLWKSQYCRDMNIADYASLSAQASLDSNNYFVGVLMQSFTPVMPGATQNFLTKNMADIRMFPRWDATQARSETYVRYEVRTPAPTGATINVSASDRVVFYIASGFMWGDALDGRMALDYVTDVDTQSVPIEYPFDDDMIAAIRDGINFERVPIDISMTLRMPQVSEVDGRGPDLGMVVINYTLWDTANPSSGTVTGVDTIYNARANEVQRITVDATALLNNLPNEISAVFSAKIPAGSPLYLVTDRIPYGLTASSDSVFARMNVYVDAQYKADLRLAFQVVQPTTLDLGTNVFDMAGYVPACKMTDREGVLTMRITNNTNIHIHVKSLMAPEEQLLGFPDLDASYVGAQLAESGVTSGGYVNLLTPNGFYVPARGVTYLNDIRLTEDQLSRLFVARQPDRMVYKGDIDSLFDSTGVFLGLDTAMATDDAGNPKLYGQYETRAGWLWRLEFEQGAMDALHDTDWIDISSSVGVSGVASSDSLFSGWGN